MGIHIALCQVSLAVLFAAAVAGVQLPSESGHGLPPLPPTRGQTSTGICGAARYWNSAKRRCVDCTPCTGPGREVTVRPCDGHRDTQCGSLTDLNIDWAWLRERIGKNGAPEIHERINSLSEAEARLLRPQTRQPPQLAEHEKLIDFGDDYILPDQLNHPKQQQQQHAKKSKKHLKRGKKASHSDHFHHKAKQPKPFGDYDDFGDFGASGDAAVDSDDEDLALASWWRTHRHRTAPAATTTTTTTTTSPRPASAVSLVEDFIVVKEDRSEEEVMAELEGSLKSRSRSEDDVVATTQTFSTAETLVWDWQAGVLVAAVCACLLFFIVAAGYSCQHAWHFNKLKKHLDADLEEISTRLTLMSEMGSEHLHDSSAPAGTEGSTDKAAFPVRRGDHLRTGRQQNEYCLATLPRKTRV